MKFLGIVIAAVLLVCATLSAFAHEKLREGYLVYGPKIEMGKVVILLNTSIFGGKSIESKYNFTAHYRYNPAGGLHQDKPVFIFVTAEAKTGYWLGSKSRGLRTLQWQG